MKTVFFILSALTLMAFGCNKKSGVDSGTDIQREEKIKTKGDVETYQLEEKGTLPANEEIQREEVPPAKMNNQMQKQDENHKDHIKQQEEAKKSADESVDLSQE